MLLGAWLEVVTVAGTNARLGTWLLGSAGIFKAKGGTRFGRMRHLLLQGSRTKGERASWLFSLNRTWVII